MLYRNFLKKHRWCPFCGHHRQESLISRRSAFLTYALAPYSRYHLLVVPKRHITRFSQLNRLEKMEIAKLLEMGAKILHTMKVRNWTILTRDGNYNKQKSVRHFHYHLIPNHRIGDLDSGGKPRVVLTERAIKRLTKEIREAL